MLCGRGFARTSVFVLLLSSSAWAEQPSIDPNPADAPAAKKAETTDVPVAKTADAPAKVKATDAAVVAAETTDVPVAKTTDAKTTGAKSKPAAAQKKCEVVVLNLVPRGLPKEQEYVAEILTNTLAGEIEASAGCAVVTEADIKSMLDFEATKAACGEADDSCLAEIGNALGVDLVVGGLVGKLGDSFTLQVSLRDVTVGKVLARVNETMEGEPELLNQAAKRAGRALFHKEPLVVVDKSTSFEVDKMTLGIGLMGGGLLLAAAGGAAWGAADVLLGEKELFGKTATRSTQQGIQIGGLIGVAGLAVGIVVVAAGAGIAAMGVSE